MLEIKETSGNCISCGYRNGNIREVSISRKQGVYKGENIICFNLCNDCLRTLAKEFVKYS